jgi:hypothetical protein
MRSHSAVESVQLAAIQALTKFAQGSSCQVCMMMMVMMVNGDDGE